MSGYTQTELQAIFSAAGVASDNAQRRLASIITKAYVDMGVIRVVSTTGGAGAPLYNYNTRKYFAAMSKPIIDLATACYGQGYTAAEITALAQTEAYGPLSYSFATYAPDIVLATFACMEAGAEILSNPLTLAATWTPAGDFSVASAALLWTHNTNSGTMTQANADLAGTLTNSAWYVFDFEITTAATTVARVTKLAITTGLLAAETPIIAYTTAGIGTAQKASVFIKAKSDTSASDFVISATDNGSDPGAYVLDNFSLKEITNSAFSTNPLSVFSSTQELYYQSFGSNYCKKFIAGVVISTLQKMAEGEYGVYGTINKIAEPVLDYYTT